MLAIARDGIKPSHEERWSAHPAFLVLNPPHRAVHFNMLEAP
jgi:hypothetical protein